MTKEGIYVRNKTKSKDTKLHYFVRADDWYYWNDIKYISEARTTFRGNKDLSLAAPIMLGRFKYD